MGGGLVERTGTLGRVRASLAAAGVECVEFPGVLPNPDVAPVREGIELARRERVQLVLAVGGGSIIDNGPRMMADPTNVDIRGDLMVAGDLAHNSVTAFGIRTDWTNHAIEEPVSGMYPQLAHGAGLAITTHCWMRYVYQSHLDVFVRFAVNVMGVRADLGDRERTALAGIEALEDWARRMGLPLTWAEVGLEDADFEMLAKRACGYHADGKVGGLEKLDWRQVLDIYRMAL